MHATLQQGLWPYLTPGENAYLRSAGMMAFALPRKICLISVVYIFQPLAALPKNSSP